MSIYNYYSNESITIQKYVLMYDVCRHTWNMTHAVNVINYIVSCVSSLDQ